MIDRKRFFASVRQRPFPGRLTPGQVEGMSAILNEWERRGLSDSRWLAYMFATTKHETAHTMQPIREHGGPGYFKRMYDIEGQRPRVAKALGNLKPGDGVRFHGRGYVQLTGRANYEKFHLPIKRIWPELDLLERPDDAMVPKAAAFVLFEGMTQGSFTGKKLSNYFTNDVSDWKNARKIINGLDKADVIAGIAKEFYSGIMSATTGA